VGRARGPHVAARPGAAAPDGAPVEVAGGGGAGPPGHAGRAPLPARPRDPEPPMCAPRVATAQHCFCVLATMLAPDPLTSVPNSANSAASNMVYDLDRLVHIVTVQSHNYIGDCPSSAPIATTYGAQAQHICETLSLLAAAVQRMGDKIMAYAVLRWVTLVCALHPCLCTVSLFSHAIVSTCDDSALMLVRSTLPDSVCMFLQRCPCSRFISSGGCLTTPNTATPGPTGCKPASIAARMTSNSFSACQRQQ